MSSTDLRSRTKSLRLPLVLCVAAVLPLAACTAGGAAHGRTDSDTGEPAVTTAIPALLDTAHLALPVERYVPTPDQVRLVDQARLRLIDRCMTRFGMRYQVALPRTAGAHNQLYRRYGITDARAAAVDGYGVAADDPGRQPRPPKPKLGPEGETALFGKGRSTVRGITVPAGGCVGEANGILAASGPPVANPTLGQNLSAESFQRSQRDSRVLRGFAAWSGCMARDGYYYTDPLQPPADPQLGDGSGTEATRIARADVACKQQTNLVGTWYTVESAYQQRMIEANQTALNTVRQSIDSQLAAARTTG
jgi:hypothetical protein